MPNYSALTATGTVIAWVANRVWDVSDAIDAVAWWLHRRADNHWKP